MIKIKITGIGLFVLAMFITSVYINDVYGLTNSETNASLQFNFNNPGSRAGGMGGAFISQANDATTAYANPAGLVNLFVPEISVEMKHSEYSLDVPNYYREWTNYEYGFDGGGSHSFSETITNASFMSVVYPFKRMSFSVYRHELVNYESHIHTKAFDMGGEWNAILPTRSDVDLRITDYGFSGAFRVLDQLNLGATVRFSKYEMESEIARYNYDLFTPASDADYSSDNMLSEWRVDADDQAVSFILGLQYKPTDALKIGAVYRSGPEFDSTEVYRSGPANDTAGNSETPYTFKVPDCYGLGISYLFFDKLTLAFDYVRVEYSDLMDEFQLSVANTGETSDDYEIEDANEFHLGAEYLLFLDDMVTLSEDSALTGAILVLRAGYWFNPEHSIRFVGNQQDSPSRVIFSGGEDDHNGTLGLGVILKNFEVDSAVNFSDFYNSVSLTAVYRF